MYYVHMETTTKNIHWSSEGARQRAIAQSQAQQQAQADAVRERAAQFTKAAGW